MAVRLGRLPLVGRSGVLATGILVVVSGALTARTLYGHWIRANQPPTQPYAQLERPIGRAPGGHRVGRVGATVLVVAFVDYQCEACLVFDRRMRSLMRRHPEVAVVYHQASITYHPLAQDAARAAQCAAQAGRFEAMHENMLTRFDRLDRESFEALADRAGIPDTAGFRLCRTGAIGDSALARDQSLARAVGVSSTPTFVIGRNVYTGVPWDLEAIVQRAVRQGTTGDPFLESRHPLSTSEQP